RADHSKRRYERRWSDCRLSRRQAIAFKHRHGRRIRPQRLGRTVASTLGVRSPFAKGDETNAQKTFRLGRRLDRQQRCSLSQPRAWRKGRLDLPNVCRRKKFETPDQDWAFSKREHAVTSFVDLAQKLSRFCQSLRDFARVFTCTLGVLRAATAFSANNRRDLLNQLVCLKSRAHFLWYGGDQCNCSIRRANEKNRTVEFRLQRIGHCLQQLSIAVFHLGDTEIFSSMR